MDEIGLWFAAVIAFIVIGLVVSFCDPGGVIEENRKKEEIEYQQKLEKEKWIQLHCKVKKEITDGFFPRTIYKCDDGSTRTVNQYMRR